MPRLQNENTEYRLSPIVFHRILEVFYCKPEIDLIASCMNYQIGQYTSWQADRNAKAIDPFSISWEELNFYAFHPFSLIGAAVAKVRKEKFSVIMINTMVENTVLVSHDGIITVIFPILLPPNILTLQVISSSLIRENFGNTNLPREITDVIADSWRTTTGSWYESVLRR